ncbi:polysaccharide deacetylase family protein [uncultured Clostridium sp.]|uniref:polysaccharide deacetylase family protein n=1 Tax=uncultured Clostridium sp. TaxID=59620 RepID=UPI003458548A
MMRRKRRKIKKMALAMLVLGCMIAVATAAYAGAPSASGNSGTENKIPSERQMSQEGQSRLFSQMSQDGQTANQETQAAVHTIQEEAANKQPESQAQLPPSAETQVPQAQTQQSEAELESRAAESLTAEIEKDAEEAGLVLSGGRYLDPSKPMIALTFDDGPYAPVGNRIMDSMEQYNGRATFFVVGNRVADYKTEIKRMHDNGHEIANHTYDHKYLNKLSADEIVSQVELCNQAVAAITGESPRLVRLPGGSKNSTVLGNVHYPIILWNIDTLDWKTKNADKSVEAVLGKVKDGDIILMHELYKSSGDAAVRIIPALSEQGYQLVTVSELIRFRGGVKNGGVYYSFHQGK